MSDAHMCQMSPVSSFGSLIFILFLLLLAVDRSVDHRGSSSIQQCLCLVFIGSGVFFSTHTGLDSGWTGVWLSDSWML